MTIRRTLPLLTAVVAAALLAVPACTAEDKPTKPANTKTESPAGTTSKPADPEVQPDKQPAKPAAQEPATKRKYSSKEKRLAKKHFKFYCATCHGKKGKGDGPAGLPLKPPPRDWSSAEWQDSVDDERIFKVIRDGGAAVGLSAHMAANPLYRDQPGVIHALVAEVRRYGKKK